MQLNVKILKNKYLEEIMEKPMDVEEIAKYLHKEVNTIYQMTHKRIIPHMKVGGTLLFDKEEIDNWLKTKKVQIRSYK